MEKSVEQRKYHEFYYYFVTKEGNELGKFVARDKSLPNVGTKIKCQFPGTLDNQPVWFDCLEGIVVDEKRDYEYLVRENVLVPDEDLTHPQPGYIVKIKKLGKTLPRNS